ncbi:hypothetical protein [Candidatus Nitrosotenuis aquarius]|uniref:hypothetical protein n=1 Tax=Candidatus Nitrosotenuis aquarius TaxID=1846278 RepID=UPI000C1F3818|nr:hypothetical protein [Candidatus Nitrosotenuis aquarius]
MKISFTFVIAALSLLSIPALAADAQTVDEQKSYRVGIYLLNVGKIDLHTSSYDLDFYMWVYSEEDDFTKSKPKIEFMNGKATIEPITVEPHYYEARVKGTFLNNLDFHQYPFEQIHLTVEIEGLDEHQSLVLMADPDESGIDKLISIPGWNLVEMTQDILIHDYPDGKEYSRYVFTMTIERFFLSSFLKTLLPIIIITTIAMLAFWMSPANFAPRIGLGASTLLAAVAAHLNAANQLPPVGYLTLLDKIMIIAYALFLNNLLSMVIQMRYVDHDMKDKAVQINARMRKFMPIIVIVIFFSLLII